MKMLSSLKHYTAYSVETSRFTFSAPLSNFTLHDSNLPQYEAAFVNAKHAIIAQLNFEGHLLTAAGGVQVRGNASGVMCSYFAPNGVSSCGNSYLLRPIHTPQNPAISHCFLV